MAVRSFISLVAFTVSVGMAAVVSERTSAQIPRDFTGRRLPLSQNGFVLAYDFDRAVVWSFDRNGKQLMQVQLTVPDSPTIRIRNIGAAPDGTVAVTASASDNQGHIAPVIFWITPSGAIARIVRTSPFSASRLAFASDGSLWAAGRVYNFDGAHPPASQFQVAEDYDVLRHYDLEGRLQQTALPRLSFPVAVTDPTEESFLAISPDRIGFLSVSAKEYVEISPSGQMLGRWGLNSPIAANTAVGLALTSTGAVFLSMLPRVEANVPYQGPPLYQFDKSTGKLQSAQLSSTGLSRPTALLGSDGDELVFYSKPPAVSWFTIR